MKKVLLLLTIISLVSCVNNAKKDTSGTDSTIEEEVNERIVENTPSDITEDAEDLYTYEEDEIDIPNTNPSYNPNLNDVIIPSEERIYGNDYNYPNYEETDGCVEGVVVYEGTGDYYIVETRKGYTLLERYSGILNEGDKVRGELNRYNFKYIINRNRNTEVRVYIEDYMLTDKSALEWLGEHDHLKYDDQRAYDAYNE